MKLELCLFVGGGALDGKRICADIDRDSWDHMEGRLYGQVDGQNVIHRYRRVVLQEGYDPALPMSACRIPEVRCIYVHNSIQEDQVIRLLIAQYARLADETKT